MTAPLLSRSLFLRGAAGVIGTTLAVSVGKAGFAAGLSAATVAGSPELLSAATVASSPKLMAAASPQVVYFGTGGMGEGIHVFEMDPDTGLLTKRSVTKAPGPGWITLDPTESFLYAAIDGNQLSSFAIKQPNASLTPLNAQPTGSTGSAYISVDPTRRYVVGASWDSGTVSVLPIRPDGQLGAVTDVVQQTGDPGPHPDQTQARAHMTAFDPSGRWTVVTDLGLDRLYVYRLDTASGRLVANFPPYLQFERGRGPRHLAFHPNGQFAYVINELNSTMTVVRWDPAYGTFQEIQNESTLPADWKGKKWSAEVAVHPSGQFVYGSNRGSGGDSDDIVIFSIDQNTGRLTLAGHTPTLGQVPRNFNIDPSGRFLICVHQDSNNVVTFLIDQVTGALTPTGQSLEVINAICTQFAQTLA
jgi:6-phosphogluconolactonase